MKFFYALTLALLTPQAFGYQCEVIANYPKSGKSTEIQIEIGKKKSFGFKDSEYTCAVSTENLEKEKVTKLNLVCIIPDTELLSMTNLLIGFDMPMPVNLHLRDRKGVEIRLILACKKGS